MLHRLPLVAALWLPITAHANDWHERCASVSSLSATIMEARQVGVPMSEMMEKARDVGETVEQLVLAAYDSPRHQKDQMQQRAIEDFRDSIYLECIQNRP